MTAPPLVRLGIRVRREQAELALAALLPLLQNGVEETEPAPDEVEYVLYAPRGELPSLADVRALVGDALVDVALSDVPAGWERRWHDHLQPVEVAGGGRRVRVRPPWLEPGEDPDALDLVVDPGDLFGAGTHPTTRLCLELLLELDPGGPLCDWGTGSGILAVAAARLGFDPVCAVEVMPDGLDAVRANAARNGVAVRGVWSNLAATPAPWAPVVTANLTADLLLAIAADVLERPPERLLASGVLAARMDEVAAAYARHGMRETDRRVQGEWAAVRLESA